MCSSATQSYVIKLSCSRKVLAASGDWTRHLWVTTTTVRVSHVSHCASKTHSPHSLPCSWLRSFCSSLHSFEHLLASTLHSHLRTIWRWMLYSLLSHLWISGIPVVKGLTLTLEEPRTWLWLDLNFHSSLLFVFFHSKMHWSTCVDYWWCRIPRIAAAVAYEVRPHKNKVFCFW